MSDCCNSAGNCSPPGKRCCPLCGSESLPVALNTVLHHLKQPWLFSDKSESYYFCDAPQCEVVYFGEDDALIKTSALRSVVGIKAKNEEALLCYCFGITRGDLSKEPTLRDYIIQQTKAAHCSCGTSNPSGRCCLRDLPRSE